MIIGIDMGHTLTGKGTGAMGYASETEKNRAVGKRLIAMLQEKGHKVINCTVDKSNNDLADRCALANKQHLDIFISLHLNAYKKVENPMGVEVYTVANSSLSTKAQVMLKELVAATGWKSRGCKTANYYVLKNTKAPAMLLELGFCDSKADMDAWNTENIARAIFKGLTGETYAAPAANSQPPTNDKGETYYRVCVGSYNNKANAQEQQDKLKKAGFDSFLVAFKK